MYFNKNLNKKEEKCLKTFVNRKKNKVNNYIHNKRKIFNPIQIILIINKQINNNKNNKMLKKFINKIAVILLNKKIK